MKQLLKLAAALTVLSSVPGGVASATQDELRLVERVFSELRGRGVQDVSAV